MTARVVVVASTVVVVATTVVVAAGTVATASVVAGSGVSGVLVEAEPVEAGSVVGTDGLDVAEVVNLLVAETLGGWSDERGTVLVAVDGALTGSATVVPMISMVAAGVGGATYWPRAGESASARRHAELTTAMAPGHADDRTVERRGCRVMSE